MSALGAGPVRIHETPHGYTTAPEHGFTDPLGGADILLHRWLIRAHFPFLAEDTAAVLHVRRAGWLSAQQLGAQLLERAKESGVRLVRGKVAGIHLAGGRVSGVTVGSGADESEIQTSTFVNAAGRVMTRAPRIARIRKSSGKRRS